MGDMADFILEQIDYSIYNGYEDSDGYEQAITSVECRCCHRKNLRWGERNGKWRLFDNRGIHVCPVNPRKELSK